MKARRAPGAGTRGKVPRPSVAAAGRRTRTTEVSPPSLHPGPLAKGNPARPGELFRRARPGPFECSRRCRASLRNSLATTGSLDFSPVLPPGVRDAAARRVRPRVYRQWCPRTSRAPAVPADPVRAHARHVVGPTAHRRHSLAACQPPSCPRFGRPARHQPVAPSRDDGGATWTSRPVRLVPSRFWLCRKENSSLPQSVRRSSAIPSPKARAPARSSGRRRTATAACSASPALPRRPPDRRNRSRFPGERATVADSAPRPSAKTELFG